MLKLNSTCDKNLPENIKKCLVTENMLFGWDLPSISKKAIKYKPEVWYVKGLTPHFIRSKFLSRFRVNWWNILIKKCVINDNHVCVCEHWKFTMVSIFRKYLGVIISNVSNYFPPAKKGWCKYGFLCRSLVL